MDQKKKRAPSSSKDRLIRDALRLWLEQKIAWTEAIANSDPHEFPEEFDQKTLQMMEKRWDKSKKKARTSWWMSYQTIVGTAVAACLLLIVVRSFTPTSENNAQPKLESAATDGARETASSAYAGEESRTAGVLEKMGEQLREKMQDQKPLENRTVPKELYASYSGRIVFVDPRTDVVYRSEAGKSPIRLYDLSKLVDERMGVEHIGEVDGVVYVAFYDGSGAELSGTPVTATETEYWQEYWFSGQTAPDQAIRKGIIVDGVQFSFEVD
ncbi:MAG: hypothetical protein SOR89_02650 [Ndongobacter sp.]|nr:hypothetical protein [Ndongobacter sp.]